MSYKHEGYKVGDCIRAYDFEPMEGRPERYVEGIIYKIAPRGTEDSPFAHYGIKVYADTLAPKGARTEVNVPMEVFPQDRWWDDRVRKVEGPLNIRELL